MNTIEEISEISEIKGDSVNGSSSTITTKITSTTTSTSSSSNGSVPTSPISQSPKANGAAAAADANSTVPGAVPASNGHSTSSSSDGYLEDLKSIGHVRNIQKLNESRRVFLSNTISSAEYTSDEHSSSATKAATATNQPASNGDAASFSTAYNSKKTLVREQYIDKTSEAEVPLSVSVNKYATLPLKAPRTPTSPPPKPPMLSRTRSIGIGDRASLSSPPATPKSPGPHTASTQFSTTTATATATPAPYRITTTNIQVQPTESSLVTSSHLAQPSRVQCVEINPEEDHVVLRSSLAAADTKKMNGTVDQLKEGFAPDAALKDIPAKHYERVIEELKCPGCAFPMKAPIYLCRTGHSVCDQCTRILMLCPLCKEPYTNIRSRTVEALCSKAHFKCTNAAGGCTVRLQIDLLSWHEKQCIYKPMKCFMGRVWGDCQWSGREAFWKEHLEAEHNNKVFRHDSVNLIWNMGVKQKPLTGYYVFQVYNEMFNFYEIYDKERILFTMTCTSTQKEKKHLFAYEITLINEEVEALSQTQKFPVHSEYDSDILAEGTCVCFAVKDLTKFLDEEKLLHYRVRVLEVKSPRRSRALRAVSPNGNIPIDFQQTMIEGVNLKNVPSDVIVTRRFDNIPFVDNEDNAGYTSEDEIEKSKREFYKKLEAKKKHDSSSDTDPEFEAFIAKKWGTPQMNFNRKYLKSNTSDSSSSNEDAPKSPKTANDDKMSVASTSYKKRVSNTLRQSFRSLKNDIIEMKPFGKKSSPEKK